MTEQTETERNEARIDRENGLKILDMVNAINKGMPVKTETEMAIHYLKEMAKKQSCIEYYEALQIAISALKQQSEAERRIEEIRSECDDCMAREPSNEFERGWNSCAKSITRILEGKTE